MSGSETRRALFIFPLLYLFGLNGLHSQHQLVVEAETGHLSGVTSANSIPGYSGTGFVTGFNESSDYLEVDFNISLADLYKIELIYASSGNDNLYSQLMVDGKLYDQVRHQQSDSFVVVNAGSYQFLTGMHTLRLQYGNAPVQPDHFRLSPVSELPGISLDQQNTRVEAEGGILFGTRVEFGTSGYSGNGYVSNFDTPDSDRLRLLVHSSESGEYELIIGFATPYGYKENYLSINGGPRQTIPFEAISGFGEVKAGKVLLGKGINTIDIIHFWGWFELDYFKFSQVIGQAPNAVSQGNILVHDELNDGKETVTLDASGSMDSDGHITTYLWQLKDGTVIGDQPVLVHSFTVGTHEAILQVTDNDGNRAVDPFVIIVADLDHSENHRLPIRKGRDSLFMSGLNIAWTTNSNFAKDLTNYNESAWITILDDIERAGGNAIRWWLHTNGSASPVFGADGKVSGLHSQTIGNIRKVLDLAYERGIVVSLCLWSFDMLQNQGQNLAHTRSLLEDTAATLSYIHRALIPMVQALDGHPAIMTWEIFNEPEGMTTDFGWSAERTTMQFIQRFVNLCAGAIHRVAPEALISNGSWSFQASSDVAGYMDFYRDDRLIAAGGDPEGTLDFIQVHYYDHLGLAASPFHHPASHWGIDKPIVIGEFPAHGIEGFTVQECYQFAYRLGYAGALAWSYSDTQFGGLPAARPGMLSLFGDYPEDVTVPDTNTTVSIREDRTFEMTRIFPNPTGDELKVELKDWDVQVIRFEIFSNQGQLIQDGRMKTGGLSILILSDLPAGSYHLRLSGKDQSDHLRFLKL